MDKGTSGFTSNTLFTQCFVVCESKVHLSTIKITIKCVCLPVSTWSKLVDASLDQDRACF